MEFDWLIVVVMVPAQFATQTAQAFPAEASTNNLK